MKKILLILFISILSLHATLYMVDNKKSYIGFGVKNMLLPYTVGQFKTYSGSFSYDETHNFFLSLDGEVRAASIHTESEDRDTHLRSEDFFDVLKYPHMTFRLIRQHKKNQLIALLTIRGITKPVVFTISDVHNPESDSKGNTFKNFTLKATINRHDFKVSYNSFFGLGEKLIEDMVDIELIIVGIHKASYE